MRHRWCCFFLPNPYGAPEHRKALGGRPEGQRDGSRWSPARTGTSCRATAENEARSAGGCRAMGRPFLSSISFGRTKEMDPGVQGRSHPQVAVERGRRPLD